MIGDQEPGSACARTSSTNPSIILIPLSAWILSSGHGSPAFCLRELPLCQRESPQTTGGEESAGSLGARDATLPGYAALRNFLYRASTRMQEETQHPQATGDITTRVNIPALGIATLLPRVHSLNAKWGLSVRCLFARQNPRPLGNGVRYKTRDMMPHESQ
ncbi:hypothetical protein RRG08_019041 [Elysia crispata]|uniref:Uncharacterized protein n=1 Tax=Elysia crispata TaxID=231223 RepID=A0AAE1A585_9GAST|nr:hypothetical protein RRG08_019041 [Elysia crispata]